MGRRAAVASMKPNLRLQALLALTCLGFLVALLTVQASTANLCTVSVPASGGYLVEGLVGRPEALNPLLADANPIDRAISSLLFNGLTAYDGRGRLVPDLASSWEVSEDGRTIAFTLRGARWHDGEPVTAADVAFTYGLLQDPEFPGPGGLKALWQAVEIEVLARDRVTFSLPAPYAPFLEATTRGLLPAHLLAGTGAATLPALEFNRQPIGTGPFVVESDTWVRTGRLRLAPNPAYWRGGLNLAGLELRFFSTAADMLSAFRDGEIVALHQVGPAALPAAAALPDVRLFSWPAPRFTELRFNLTATGHPAMRDLAVRSALAAGVDRDALIDRALNGQGLPLSGPYLPRSWAYRPDLHSTRPHDPAGAAAALEAAGWVLAEGATARVQNGTELALRLVHGDQPIEAAAAAEIARQWAALGVGVTLQPVPIAELPARLAERAFDVAILEVAPLGDPDLYDFWSQEAIVRGQNYGGWNNRRASEALEQARQTWPLSERQAFYERFQRLYDQALPALTLYQDVNTYALAGAVQSLAGNGQAEVGLIVRPLDRYRTLPDWFLLYRDVLIACPDDTES